MAYISLYRKYRPQRFADVVGQDHVVQTLRNSLGSGRIANGYLFCGTRGVAKTTIARIFAKCLNCIGPDGARTAPSDEPCDQCAPCRSISAGQCVDVIEMDAASNRSVSDMAKVRENVQFGPMENRFKTYIVDEAHQLSTDAKDAFLKTLEEPPPNVVFILATTESHAIPVTIASRCQQFDFKRGSIGTISKQIRKVLDAEGVTMNADAVTLVARAAEGSYRDGLSILEQVVAYKREDINAFDVVEILGSVDGSVTGKVIAMIAAKDAAGAFALAEEIFIGGKDIRQFLKTLAAHLRDLLFTSVGAKSAGDDEVLAGEIQAQLRDQAALFTPSALLRMLEILAEAERESKTANQQRILLEMTLLRLMMPPEPAPIASASSGQFATAQVVNPPAAIQRPAPSTHTPTARPATPTASSRTADMTSKAAIPEIDAAPEPMLPTATTNGAGTPMPPNDEPAVKRPEPETPPGTDYADTEVSQHQVTHDHGSAGVDDQLAYLKDHWQEVIHHFQAASPAGVPLVNDGRPVGLESNTFAIAFTKRSFVDMLDNEKRKIFLEGMIDKVLRADKGTYRIKAELGDPADLAAAASAANAAPRPAQAPIAPTPSLPEAPETSEASTELLDEVIAIFGGKIIEDE